MRSVATRILTAAGIAAPLLWAAAVIYCGAVRPGYNPVTQFISELAERGSSTESVMRITAFYIPGVLIVMFGVLLLTRSAGLPVAALLIVHGVGRLTAGTFPCDPGCPVPGSSLSQVVHNVAGMLNISTLPAAALFCFLHFRKIGRHRFAWYSLVSAIVGTVFLVLTVLNAPTHSHVGLFQRLSFGIMHLWLGVFALSIWPSRIEATDPRRTGPA
jgi:hypothetical membrane protein